MSEQAEITKSISKGESFSLDSSRIVIKSNQKYAATAVITAKKGLPYSGCFCILLFDSLGRERGRRIRWITDFSGNPKEYKIIFGTHPDDRRVAFGYRINTESPVKSDVEITFPSPSVIRMEEIEKNAQDESDKLDNFIVPPMDPLTSEEEAQLERRITWIFASPRSGTTWLGPRLLDHPPNIVWNEPWIGYHIAAITTREDMENDRPVFERLLDTRSNEHQYFFSPNYRNIWIPALRKFILARTYAHSQTLSNNIIIKEPAGAYAADIILECLPKSKMIFLLRDGRDVAESRMDNEMKGWPRLSADVFAQKRYRIIQFYSLMWNMIIKSILVAYDRHDPQLKLLVRYENLKNDTFAEMQRIYKFLDVEINEEELRKRIEGFDFKNIPSSEKGPGKFNRAATTGAWKNTFSQKEQELMNSIMGPLLTQLGYKN